MSRFALFSKATGALVAQGQCADGTEPSYDADAIDRLWLGDNHEIHGNHCLVNGQVQERQYWSGPVLDIEQAAGEVNFEGLPSGAFLRIDPAGQTEADRITVREVDGNVAVTLPAGSFRATLDGPWRGVFARITLT